MRRLLRRVRQGLGMAGVAYTPPMGLHVAYDAVRCLWWESGDGRRQVRHQAVAPLPPGTWTVRPAQLEIQDPEALEVALRAVLPREDHPRRVAVVVPDASVVFSVLRIESWPRRLQDQWQLIQWQLRRQTTLPLEAYRVVWQVVEVQGPVRTVAVLAAWQPFLDRLEDLLGRCGVVPGLLVPEHIAIDDLTWYYVGSRPDWADRRWMVFHWDGERLTMTHFHGSRLVGKRTYALAPESAEAALGWRAALEQELRRIAAYLQDFHGEDVLETVFLSGSDAESVAARLRAWMPFPLEVLDVWNADPGLPPLDPHPDWQPLLGVLVPSGT